MNSTFIFMRETCLRYDSLNKRLKQVARYVPVNPDSIAFDTMAIIAGGSEVTPSTFIRFSNAFGFGEFNEIKNSSGSIVALFSLCGNREWRIKDTLHILAAGYAV
ncbi:MurR/RpiR family transcriptional regulator [Cedecea colo]|uniref:MurR/RpiR family transcriptional regulator n=1 Tax=Cedecea colo TaxID=2552946 RepID=A0ABX0VS52_9ENTR|nr:MurR/RpiR family transcriptional regulator [Cedecea colo]